MARELSLRQRAFGLLARREHSRAELQAKLARHRQETDEPLETLLDDLTERGYLSDERAAAQWVAAKQSRYGPRRIAQDLRQKGIDDELIAASLPQDNELETARAVWQRKFSSPPQDERERARQMRFLLGRGFSPDTVFRVLREANDETA